MSTFFSLAREHGRGRLGVPAAARVAGPERSVAPGESADAPVEDRRLTFEKPEPLPHLLAVALLFEAGLGLIAVVLGWLLNVWPLDTLGITRAAILWGVIGTFPLLLVIVLVDRYPIGPLKDLKRVVDQLVAPLFRGMRWWELALISAAAGVGEELLFRGFLQAGIGLWLADWLGPRGASVAALVVASVAFGLLHPITTAYAAYCFFMGLYLGVAWLMSGNLLVPIVIHSLYDFAALMRAIRKEGVAGTTSRSPTSD